MSRYHLLSSGCSNAVRVGWGGDVVVLVEVEVDTKVGACAVVDTVPVGIDDLVV